MDSKSLALNIRRLSLQMVHDAKSSHIGSALSIADILAVLYGDVMRYSPEEPQNKFRDRFILSKGHACAAVYATLALVGFYPQSDLRDYGEDDSRFMTHISHKVPGVEFSTGSLGHGLPYGAGKALALKYLGLDSRVFVLLGDGELDEGTTWEASLFANHHALGNLVAIVDRNRLQSLEDTETTMRLDPLPEKFISLGWHVILVDGHDHEALKLALVDTSKHAKPVMVIAETTKGKGVSFMEGSVAWHYKSPNAEQLESGLQELN